MIIWLGWLGLVSIIVAFLLAVHHDIIHRDEPPADGIEGCFWLQPSDVCAPRHTHETWIVGFLLLGIVFLVVAAASSI